MHFLLKYILGCFNNSNHTIYVSKKYAFRGKLRHIFVSLRDNDVYVSAYVSAAHEEPTFEMVQSHS